MCNQEMAENRQIDVEGVMCAAQNSPERMSFAQ
jgi:hypothetical protein